jgi:DNA-binding MarR family transcriptional regulator
VKQISRRVIDYEALAALRYEIRRYLHFGQKAARQAGIDGQQYQALLAVKGLPRNEKPTVGALAEQMQIEHHSAVELSRRLERNGWVRRARSGADRREVRLRLTPRGEKLLAKLSLSHRDELRTAEPKLIRALQAAINRRKKNMR